MRREDGVGDDEVAAHIGAFVHQLLYAFVLFLGKEFFAVSFRVFSGDLVDQEIETFRLFVAEMLQLDEGLDLFCEKEIPVVDTVCGGESNLGWEVDGGLGDEGTFSSLAGGLIFFRLGKPSSDGSSDQARDR